MTNLEENYYDVENIDCEIFEESITWEEIREAKAFRSFMLQNFDKMEVESLE